MAITTMTDEELQALADAAKERSDTSAYALWCIVLEIRKQGEGS